MGYGGKFVERERARELRARAWTLQEIADELGVAKGTVSVWVRDVDFTPRPRNRGHARHQPHPLHQRKLADIEHSRVEAEATVWVLSGSRPRSVDGALESGARHTGGAVPPALSGRQQSVAPASEARAWLCDGDVFVHDDTPTCDGQDRGGNIVVRNPG
jgi:hypothetical protein